MRLLNILLIIALALLVQSMLLSRFALLQALDLFLLLNIYCGLNFSPLFCLGIAVMSGLVQDTFSTGILGLNAFSKAIIAYTIATLSSRLMIKQTFVILFLVALFSVIDLLTIYWLQRMFSISPVDLTLRMILASSFSNVIGGFVLFAIADRVRASREYT